MKKINDVGSGSSYLERMLSSIPDQSSYTLSNRQMLDYGSNNPHQGFTESTRYLHLFEGKSKFEEELEKYFLTELYLKPNCTTAIYESLAINLSQLYKSEFTQYAGAENNSFTPVSAYRDTFKGCEYVKRE